MALACQYFGHAKEFKDRDHPDSGTPLVKIQHPEYEFFQGSLHVKMGAACPDCHMPKVKVNGKEIDLILKIQDENWNLYNTAGEKIEAAMKAIAGAKDVPGVKAETIKEARDLHRAAQLYWDFHAAENSMGFHDPAETKENLQKAIELAEEAVSKLGR